MVGEIELEQAGESPFEGEHAGSIGLPQQLGQSGHRLAIDFQIDAGVFIGGFGHDLVRDGMGAIVKQSRRHGEKRGLPV